MVAVHIDERLFGHPEKTGRLPSRHAALREPCRASMPQGVGDDIVAKPRFSAYRPEGLIDALHGLAVPLDERADRNAFALPAP